jgi:hypothetical protein
MVVLELSLLALVVEERLLALEPLAQLVALVVLELEVVQVPPQELVLVLVLAI